MDWLYHRVPDDMKGTTLYPLHRLAKIHADSYKREVQKYSMRKRLLDEKITPLNCRWNDAIHMTAVNPDVLKKTLVEAGWIAGRPLKFFKIDSNKLNAADLVVCLFDSSDCRLNSLEGASFEK